MRKVKLKMEGWTVEMEMKEEDTLFSIKSEPHEIHAIVLKPNNIIHVLKAKIRHLTDGQRMDVEETLKRGKETI